MADIFFHSDAVQDIVSTVNAKGFFDSAINGESLSGRNCLLIPSLNDVERFRDPDWPKAEILFPMNWNDMLGGTGIPLLAATRHHSREENRTFSDRVDSAFRQCRDSVEKIAESSLDAEHGADLVTFVYEMIHIRAGCGVREGSFLEELWGIVVLGGYPCGWTGGEGGKLVVYVR